jgi:hypothetical protein
MVSTAWLPLSFLIEEAMAALAGKVDVYAPVFFFWGYNYGRGPSKQPPEAS